MIRKKINKLNIDNHIMNFSAILDISSFFIGMIINLLLIALICYYFKRKYENLEIAQNEQAKVLYQLLQQNSTAQPKVININDLLKRDTQLRNEVKIDDSDSDSESDVESDSSSDSDSESEKENEIKKITLNTETISLNETVDIESEAIEEINVDLKCVDVDKKTDTKENDYSKMTIKQLKDALSEKGINANKMKKNEMIELIEKAQIIVEKSSVTIDE